MQRYLPVAVVTWLLIQPESAGAYESYTQLPEAVVTATRTRTRADDTTSSVSIISGTDIEQRDQPTVADALRGAPGMDINEFGSLGQSAFVSIRGSAPDQVLVLLDGVEVNTPTIGQFDFANLTTDNVDRIEILRGGGTLYGSEAIGGVVNVLTQRGEGPFHLLASGDVGSALTHHEVLGVNGAQGPFALSGTASFLGSDGFRSINSDYRNFSSVWRADLDVLPTGMLRGFLRYSDARTGLANFNVSDDYKAMLQEAKGQLDPYAYSRDNFFLAKGEWEHAVTDTLNYRAALSFVRDNPRYRDSAIDDDGEVEPVVISHSPSEIIAADTQVNYLWHDIALTSIGFEYKEQWAEIYKYQLQSGSSDPDSQPDIDDNRGNRSIVGVYGQEQLKLLDDTLHGVGIVRYDHYDVFGSQVTCSGSGTYLIRPTSTRLKVSYAEAFRAPSFDELFGTLGNPNLKPETSWEINAGLSQDLFDTRLRFEPTYFYREVKNLIEEVEDELPPVGGVPEEEAAYNVPSTRIQGVEFVAKLQPRTWLTLVSNYTYLNFVTPSGALVNRPRHRGSFTAVGRWSDLFAPGDHVTADLLVYAVGRRDSPNPFDHEDPFSPAPIGGYGRIDVALSYRFAGHWAPVTVTATARNLLNRNYAESIGFPAPPANFLAGFRYNF